MANDVELDAMRGGGSRPSHRRGWVEEKREFATTTPHQQSSGLAEPSKRVLSTGYRISTRMLILKSE